MNIALVILHADAARGGAERYTLDLARALVRAGHSVSLLAKSFGPDTGGARAVALPSSAATRQGRYRRFLASLDEHLTTHAYDVVHAMLPVPACDVYHPHAGIAAAAAAETGKRIWFNPRRRAFAAVEGELLRGPRPPVVLVLSDYVKKGVLHHYPDLPSDRLRTLFNAVDLSRFDPARAAPRRAEIRRQWGASDADVVALLIAQDFQRKGLPAALAALRLLAHGENGTAGEGRSSGVGRTGETPVPLKNAARLAVGRGGEVVAPARGEQARRLNEGDAPMARVRLVVVGKPDPAPYRAMAAQLGIADRVTFAGPAPDPVPLYAAADFFVLPTKHDPCSLVVLEALAMGLPVISTRFNGACEIMADGVHGCVLPDPADVDALAQAMGKLADGSTREAMARACMQLRPALAYERHLDQLLWTYQRIASDKGNC